MITIYLLIWGSSFNQNTHQNKPVSIIFYLQQITYTYNFTTKVCAVTTSTNHFFQIMQVFFVHTYLLSLSNHFIFSQANKYMYVTGIQITILMQLSLIYCKFQTHLLRLTCRNSFCHKYISRKWTPNHYNLYWLIKMHTFRLQLRFIAHLWSIVTCNYLFYQLISWN